MDKFARQTLSWVNEVRRDFRLGPALTELPPGEPRSPTHCPVAEGLKIDESAHARVTASYVSLGWTGSSHIRIALPDPVSQFLKKFDKGDYPKLIQYD